MWNLQRWENRSRPHFEMYTHIPEHRPCQGLPVDPVIFIVHRQTQKSQNLFEWQGPIFHPHSG